MFGGFGVPRLNGAGDTAFLAFLGDASVGVTGIFKESGGTLGEVALRGDPAPGTTATFTAFGDPALQGAGDTAFVGAFGAASPPRCRHLQEERPDAQGTRAGGRSRAGQARLLHEGR